MNYFEFFARRFHHGIWSILDAAAWPIALLALAPIVVHFQGLGAYGGIAMFTALLGFVPIAGLGMQPVMLQMMAAVSGPTADEERSHIAWTAYAIACGVAICLIVVEVIACSAIPAASLDKAFRDQRLPLALALGCGTVAVALDQISVGVLKGMTRFRESALLEIGSRFLQFAATAGGAWASKSHATVVLALGGAMLAATAIRTTVTWAIVRPSAPADRRALARRLLASGRWVVVQSVGGFPYMGLDRIIVGTLAGAALLGVYTVCVQFAQVAHVIPAALFQPVMPWVAKANAKTEVVRVRGAITLVMIFCAFFTAVIAASILAISPWALPTWLRRLPSADERHALSAAVAASALMGAAVAPYYVVLGAGGFRRVGLLNLAAGAVFTLCLFAAATRGGLVYCALSRLVPGLFLGWLWFWAAQVLRAQGTGETAPLVRVA